MEYDYDVQKVNEAVLALLYLWSWREYGAHRAWKGFDWEVLDYLHEQGWISDPKSKAKSVILTEEGMVRQPMAYRPTTSTTTPHGISTLPAEMAVGGRTSVAILRDASGLEQNGLYDRM